MWIWSAPLFWNSILCQWSHTLPKTLLFPHSSGFIPLYLSAEDLRVPLEVLDTRTVLVYCGRIRTCARRLSKSLPPYITHVINFTRLPTFPACNIGKSRGACGRGYLQTNSLHSNTAAVTHCMLWTAQWSYVFMRNFLYCVTAVHRLFVTGSGKSTNLEIDRPLCFRDIASFVQPCKTIKLEKLALLFARICSPDTMSVRKSPVGIFQRIAQRELQLASEIDKLAASS